MQFNRMIFLCVQFIMATKSKYYSTVISLYFCYKIILTAFKFG